MTVRRDDSTLVASEVRKGTLAGHYHSDRAKKIDVSTLENCLPMNGTIDAGFHSPS